MTHPLDIHADDTPTRPLIPRLVFLLAIAIVFLICASLHAQVWQYGVALVSIYLVRRTTQWEALGGYR